MAERKKKNPKLEKEEMDLTDPENKYVLEQFVKLPIEKQTDLKFAKEFCKKTRVEYKKGLKK